jgi:Fe-Mn family superoxide dismutase
LRREAEETTMHHRILPIPCKPYTLNWLPERLIVSHYENNYGTVVRSLNALRDRLAGMNPATTTAAEIRALRREELSAMASAVLHELYFANLSGGGKVPGATMVAALEEHFGGVDRWRREFVAAAQSLAGGSGWVLLSYSPHEGRLYNQIAVEDAQAIPGAVPILVLDMYEHAYHLEFGANASAYVDAFMRLFEWNVVTERLTQATAGHQRRGSQAPDDALPSISVEELGALMVTDQRPQVVDARPIITCRGIRTRCRTPSGAIPKPSMIGVASSHLRLRCSCTAHTALKSAATWRRR